MEPKRLLFVCVENSNRSQMAEAFARMHGGDRVRRYHHQTLRGGSARDSVDLQREDHP